MTTLYLGTHEEGWLARPDVAVPLMVSHNRLKRGRRLPRALVPWMLDSGGFTEVQRHGADAYSEGPRQYLAAVRRYADEIGQLTNRPGQDWMCEPEAIHGGRIGPIKFVGTHLSVPEHQYRTVTNGIELRMIDADADTMYVLQGYEYDDYWRCVDLYDQHGVDLTRERVVGLGSVCRRNRTGIVAKLVRDLTAAGIRVHVFGAKGDGAAQVADIAASVDSLAWSLAARFGDPLPGCSHGAAGTGKCNNCPRYALAFRERTLRQMAARQLDLFGDAA